MSLPSCEELYDRFVRNLASQHRGEFVAIHPDGRVLIDKNDIVVVDRALKQFGSGTFEYQATSQHERGYQLHAPAWWCRHLACRNGHTAKMAVAPGYKGIFGCEVR